MTSLPRGRHGLSRAQVAETQRARILRGTAAAMVEKGYAGTVVADIIKRAGVSRETFYQQFTSKQDCFVATLEATIEHLTATITPLLAKGTPRQQLDRAIGAYLDTLTAEPEIARLLLIETYAAGPEAMRRRLALQQQFADGIATIVGASHFACEAFVAALIGLVTARFVTEDTTTLHELREPIMALASRMFALPD